MPYCTKSDVKEVLQVKSNEPEWTEYDTELDACIASGDGLIDSILKFHGFTVPLTGTIPQPVKDASKYFAAAYARERRGPSNDVPVFYNRAMDFLNIFIQGEKNQPYLARV